MSGEGSRPPSVSGDIQLRALPAGPERSSRLFGLAPVGGRRFTISPGNVLARRFILPRGCVVSVPLPWLSPNHFRGPPFSWRRDLPQLGPEALPSVALPLPTGNPMWNPYLNELNVRRAMDRYRGIICPIWNHLLHANLNNRNLHSQKSQAGVAKPGQRR